MFTGVLPFFKLSKCSPGLLLSLYKCSPWEYHLGVTSARVTLLTNKILKYEVISFGIALAVCYVHFIMCLILNI